MTETITQEGRVNEVESPLVMMSHEQVREIAREATIETLSQLGFDVDTDKREIYADTLWLRRQRLGAEQLQVMIKRGAIAAFISGALFALLVGVKALLK
jgi:hypothetical protein